MKIKWFREAAGSKPAPQTPKVKTPKKPKVPKGISPKKFTPFKGPKSPESYKKRLYIPQKFVMAADETATLPTDEEMAALVPQGVPDIPAEEEAEGPESEWITPALDPVTTALKTLPNIESIVYEANPNCCEWCSALNGRTWHSAQEFEAEKSNIVKPGGDLKHLAHPNCVCRLKVQLRDGTRYSVDTMGNIEGF